MSFVTFDLIKMQIFHFDLINYHHSLTVQFRQTLY